MSDEPREILDSDIAIIGYAARLPGAKSIDEFWQNLRDGVESITVFNDDVLIENGFPRSLLAHPACVKAGAVLEDIESFDASFFGYSPRDAALIDPQQRLLLECAWEALETAGYDAESYQGAIGVFGGVGRNAYLLNIYSNPALAMSAMVQIGLGNSADYSTTRISYKLNLRGPSVNVQTACSTSLVAVHMACQSILNGECDMALAGGVSLNIPQQSAHLYEEGGINSPDGHCRSYDAQAKGTTGGNGGGVIVLKRLVDALADGDFVHAVIKGSAINNDGAAKVGFTAPSVDGQAEVIADALAVAGVEAETISYIEGHGTATTLGDPIEIAALTQAYRATTKKKGFCALGSVKSNLGHLDTGAGIAGLLKTTLALQHGALPPSVNFTKPNPEIDFDNSPFFVNTKLRKWEANGNPRRAGVSSFGLGGTNAHVIMEEAPPVEKQERELKDWQLLVLSAKTSSALETATANLRTHLEQHPRLELADVAYTLQVGRRVFDHRRIIIARDVADAIRVITSRDAQYFSSYVHDSREPKVVFMFSGQGSQYVNAGKGIYETEEVFREHFDQCAELLEPQLKVDLRELLYPVDEVDQAAEKLTRTEITQPLLFALEYSLARLWQHWGVRPQAMIGHSIGEYVAACLAGVFSLEDALSLVTARGRLMQTAAGGAMLSVPLSPAEVKPLLGEKLSLAAVNGESQCVVSGQTEAVEELEETLLEQGITSRRLHTSHAFHSEMMAPIMEPFRQLVSKVKLSKPKIPYVSNVTATWITEQEATDPEYWVKHLRQTVLFADGLRHFLADPQWLLLEVGPGNTLSSLAQRAKSRGLTLSSLRHPQQSTPDEAFMLASLGRLWMAGVRPDWSMFNSGPDHYRVPLPTYPFERQRYWIDRRKEAIAPSGDEVQSPVEEESRFVAPRPMGERAAEEFVAPRSSIEESVAVVWQERLGIDRISVNENFYQLGGDSLLATQIVAELRELFAIDLSLKQFFDKQTISGVAGCIEELVVAEVASLRDAPAARSIPRRTSTEFAPLSFTQEETLRLTLTHEMPPSYVGTVLSYSGPLDLRALQASADEMSRRHEALRTSIVTIDGETRQRIHPAGAAKVTIADLSGELPDKKIARVQQLVVEALAQPFDLEQAPLWRVSVFRLSDEEYVLAIALHYLMADFLSLGILIQELGALYAAFAQQQPSPLPELPISYGDWAAWQREQVRNGELEPQFSYWLDRLKDFPPVLELPFTRTQPAVPTLRGAIRLAEFPIALSDALRELSRTHHVSLYATLLAGFGLLIKSYTGREDFVLGRGVTGRTRIETEKLIGCFVNMVAMRLDLSGNPGFVQLLKRVQETIDGAYANQDVPSSKLAERLHGDTATPLARLFFNLYTAPSGPEPGGAQIKAFDLGNERRKDDVALFQHLLFGMQDVGGRLVAELKFNRDLFEVSAMDRMLEDYQGLLQTIVAAPTQQIEDLIRLLQAAA